MANRLCRRLLPAGTALVLACAMSLNSSGADLSLSITEFLAQNQGALRDQDGESPDWIELYNHTAGPLNLAGWRLTDTSNNVARWSFPATNLASAGFLMVFASGKNRTNAGAELHTNFQLADEGGYLALVNPAGEVVQAIHYATQRRNVSCGVGREVSSSPLISTGAAVTYYIPTNDILGSAWRAPSFDDRLWSTTNTPVAYSLTATTNVVLSLDINDRDNNTPALTQSGFSNFVIRAIGGTLAIQTNSVTNRIGAYDITLSNSAPAIGYDDRLRATPTNFSTFTESSLLRDVIFSRENSSTSGLDVWITGLAASRDHSVTVWSFDSGSSGSRVSDWYANGVQVITNYTFNGAVAPTTNGAGRFSFTTATDAAGRLWIGGRRDPASVDGNNAPNYGVFLNALRIAELGTGSAPSDGLAGQMHNRNSSVYLRLPFIVADPASVHEMVLRARYDDGFAAYINGMPVAALNAPAAPAWNAKATAAHGSAVQEEVRFIPPTGLLVAGTNWLAVQLMNVETNDADLFFQPELLAVQVAAVPGRYFSPSTPTLPNAAGYPGFVADTKFSVDRGFYDAPFTVAITSATLQAAIYYTTNGSNPTPTSGFLYSAPIPVTNTTLLRAAAYADGLIPSDVDTHSYIFMENVLRQPALPAGYPATWQASYPADYGIDTNVVNHANYGATIREDMRSIPVLSIVTDHNSLWHSSTGIYVNATSVHNPEGGQNWERAVSAELIRPDNTSAFQINCALRMQGNASRDNNRLAKHSFRLLFQSDYGPAKLDYDWFDGRVRRFDNLILRACFTDAWATRYSDQTAIATNGAGYVLKGTRYRPEDSLLLRDVWVKDSFAAMGHLSGRGSYVHLYVNGLYWGVYNPSERMDASFCSAHLGGNETDWDVLCGDAVYDFATLKDGSKDDWNTLLALVNTGITNEATYQAVANLVDLENLADFFLLHIFAESEDWPFHNWYAVHRRANTTNGLPATRWIFLPWDQEIVLDQYVRRNRIEVNNPDTPARIYGQLRAWPEFRRLFGDRVQKHLFAQGALASENNAARLLSRAAEIERAIVGESARWGDARETTIGSNPGHGQTFTRDEWWWPEIRSLCTNFFPAQNAVTISRLRAAGLYPALNAPQFNQPGGAVAAGFGLSVTHSNTAGVVYFTLDGSDPRAYGSGAVAATAQAFADVVPINTPTMVRARVLDGVEWSALTEAVFYPPQDLSKLALTEIMYNPPSWNDHESAELEFVELKNTGTNALNLSGLTFDTGIAFSFTNNTWLSPGQFLVLVRNPQAFLQRYPDVPVVGVYTGRLDNAGERLALRHPLGGTVLSLTYQNRAPWPAAADGHGFSVVQSGPVYLPAPEDGAKWRASSLPGGSPGADDPAATHPRIVINEVLTASTPPLLDTIELRNLEATNVNVGGWFLTDDANQPKQYRIPDGTIVSGGGYWVFVESDFNTSPGVSNSFSLSSRGEQVYLFSGDAATNLTGYSHGFAFAAAAENISFGRHINSVGEEQFPAEWSLTFSNANSGPRVGPVVINEIHYHPAPGGMEFVELLNVSTQAVALFDPAAPTNTWRLSGFNFTFPPNLVLGPGEFLLVISTNEADFRARYLVPEAILALSASGGGLQDSGERLTLSRPAPYDSNGLAFITVDSVRFNDKAPWPAVADGGGPSLQRLTPTAYGDDPTNWFGASASPGLGSPVDTDGDGLPDAWEGQHGLSAGNPGDALLDSDGDGHSNREEYLAGTNPLDPNDILKAVLAPGTNGWQVTFAAAPRIRFVVESTAQLPPLNWTPISVFEPRATNFNAVLPVAATTNAGQYFRIKAAPWP